MATLPNFRGLGLRDLVLLLVAPALAFHAVVAFQFLNWDDTFLVVANPSVNSPGWEAVRSWFFGFHVNHFHPIVTASFALEHALAGPNPVLFHATNLLLHMLNTVLVGLVLSRWLTDRSALLIGTLLFSLHPLRVETVAWVSSRKDLLCAFFLLLAVL